MGKGIIHKICRLLLRWVLFLSLILMFWERGRGEDLKSQTPSSQAASQSPHELPAAPSPTLLWSRKAGGAISALAVSQKGNAIVVATYPDPDIEGSEGNHLLTRMDSKGKRVWRKQQKFPIKQLDVSRDGALVVVSNYENQLIGFDAKGKVRWIREELCQPIILNDSKRIICYHDDDAEPQTAFDLLDWKGNRILSYPIVQDIVGLKISADERNLVMGLNGGGVILLGPDDRPIWENHVEGEIADLAVSSGPDPKVAVLFNQTSEKKTAIFDGKGTLLGIESPSFRAFQVEMAQTGNSVFYYGNEPQGQWVGGFSPSKFVETWKKGELFFTDYSIPIHVVGGQAFAGLEVNNTVTHHRESHVLAWDMKTGELQWDRSVQGSPSSYLYDFRIASDASLLVVVTDDGKVAGYRVRKVTATSSTPAQE